MPDRLNKLAEKLISLISKTDDSEELLNGLSSSLGEALGSCVLFISDEGKLLKFYKNNEDLEIITVTVGGNDYIDSVLNERLKIAEINDDYLIPLFFMNQDKKERLNKYKCVILPVISANKRIAALIVFRSNLPYLDEEITAVNFTRGFFAVILGNVYAALALENKNSAFNVKSAMDTLSYSELEAVLNVFNELETNEGLIVAKQIADKFSLTRSSIANGLRKLESAGLIETRSLGMKGMHIRVLNNKFIEEIDKLRD